ncbi:unnamed protein product [Brassicogethes aeneus]|uniref:Hydroxylysine kinase n=1 Tax=Brassicogethes aeneus TaxID=1431903 RepID=A0A9P0FE11_BRAAE|nr:unnamed protein product [Brassicogethes aeneus]
MENGDVLQPGLSIRPIINTDCVKDLVRDLYGLEVEKINELNGYDDKNYHVIGKNCTDNDNIKEVRRDGYVVKIINRLDSQKTDFFNAQTNLLIYLGKNGVICPKPVKTKSSEFYVLKKIPSGEHLVRLLEYVDGEMFCKVTLSNKLFYDAGHYVAKLDQILKNFDDPVYKRYKSLWQMENIIKLPEYLFAIKDETKRKTVETVINHFKNRVLPQSAKLEKGLIHGDFNEQNIITKKNEDWSIYAILDFGDSHFSCYLYELAICITYMILQGGNIDVGGYVLAGYTAVRTVPDIEYSLLKICIEGRICQSLVLGAYSALDDPSNTYLLSTQENGWKILNELTRIPDSVLIEKWKNTVKTYGK